MKVPKNKLRKPRAIYVAGKLLAALEQGYWGEYDSVSFGDLVKDNATNLLWPEEVRKLAIWLHKAADFLEEEAQIKSIIEGEK